MKIDEIFQQFRASIENHCKDDSRCLIKEENHPNAFGSRVTILSICEASLRLVWDGKDYCLRLEITHGPMDKKQSWIDLFESHGSPDHAGSRDKTGSLDSAISYGLDLMNINKNV
jgi:hypothetical protein